MQLDTARVRAAFPALDHAVAYFDGPGGTQVPVEVARAMADTMCSGISNRGTVTAAEQRADLVTVAGREAIADLLGCQADGVVFARSMTQATYDLARALAKQWGPGDEVVVTRLDHDANIRPWVTAAASAGATIRWVGFERDSADLTVEHVVAELSPRTRLVAVTAASNLLGTRPDIPAIAEAVHATGAGAQLYVDGVHLTPHAAVSFADLGADFYACSPYKFLGPHHGVLVADPAVLESVHPDKLLPASDAVPERFELGTLPYELLAGTAAAVDFIADLASTAAERRVRVRESMRAIEDHEDRLFARLLDGLGSLEAVRVYGAPQLRTPTALFSLENRPGAEVSAQLARRGVNAPASSFYAIEASRWLGLGDAGAIRVGVAPYNDDEDVDRLVAEVTDLAR